MLIPTPSLTSRSRRDLFRLDGLHQRLADAGRRWASPRSYGLEAGTRYLPGPAARA